MLSGAHEESATSQWLTSFEDDALQVPVAALKPENAFLPHLDSSSFQLLQVFFR